MRRALALVAAFACSCGFVRSEQRPDAFELADSQMPGWVGHNIHEMVSGLGPPTERYPNGDMELWIWVFNGGELSRSSVGGNAFFVRKESSSQVVECRDWADVDGTGIIRGVHWRGPCDHRLRIPPPQKQ